MQLSESAVIDELQRLLAGLPTPPGAIWLGYSGGADSEYLAYILGQFATQFPQWHSRIHLLHVHHGLSQHADTWAQHCCDSAKKVALPCRVLRIQLQLGPRISVEAEARRARYQAIIQQMAPGDVLLTAHHQDDQLETVLLALKRGQGPKGLAAMGSCQRFADNYWQLRPLLNVGRAQILTRVTALSLSYVHDESNDNIRYDRNFLRRDIVPRLKMRWPELAATVSRSAALCAEQQRLLDEVTQEKLQPLLQKCAFTGTPVMALNELRQLPQRWQRQLLRAFIERQALPLPSKVQLDEALLQLLQSDDDAKVHLKFAALELRRAYGHIYAMTELPEVAPSMPLSLEQRQALQQGKLSLPLPPPWHQLNGCLTDVGPRIALAALAAPLTLSYGLPGSLKCHPHYRNKARELKKIWQEAQVPYWLRPRLPALTAVDGSVLAIAGLLVDTRVLAEPQQPGVTLSVS
ncbi:MULTISPECIES: tRNA lysidine(34) synthetase TilS [unclassified Shewanella]|uniref:tRNA lysidine(34) synthetase TilS n=1 Tax=unclassified Shewanella TaxID=196818 RepID=UPI001F6258B7|nr:tRNA lysidine(34) synthetase TilS [Shewanella sp. 4t3-1-2LB]